MDVDPLTSRTADELLLDHAAFDTDDEDLAERPPLNTERDDKAILSPRKRKAGDVLGDEIVDEEVKIAKQRRKIPKLDTEKLISDPGLPKIRKLLRSGELKKKLNLKGKGHEFSDVARLLNFYQMWLDNLYPRAKFADALQMVEKAGHTKKMQMYRKSWIDEGKPGHVRKDELDNAFDAQEDVPSKPQAEPKVMANHDLDPDFDEDPSSMFFGGGDESHSRSQDGPDDDELEALLAQEDNRPVATTKRPPTNVDSEGEDDLDALLAQESTHNRASLSGSSKQDRKSKAEEGTTHKSGRDSIRNEHQAADTNSSGEHEEPEEDELDALLHQIVQSNTSDKKQKSPLQDEFDDEDFPDDDFDDFDALMHNLGTAREPELPSNVSKTVVRGVSEAPVLGSEEVPELENVGSSSPIPNIHTDDLDQLMDEHDATVDQRKKGTDGDILEEFLSSSPIQN